MLSRKIIYFLAGVIISVLLSLHSYVYADECFNPDYMPAPNYTSNNVFLGYMTSAYSAFLEVSGYTTYDSHYLLDTFASDPNFEGGANQSVKLDCYIRYTEDITWYSIRVYGLLICDLTTTDTDGDGIPDAYDLYPDNPEPYQYAIISTITDKITDEQVEITVRTDRGDIFTFGERPADMSGYDDTIFIYPDYLDDITLSSLPFFASSDDDYTVVDDKSAYYQTLADTIDNTVDNTGTGFNDNVIYSDNSETDNEALQAIMTNTADTSNNIVRLGDYLQSINDSLQSIDNRESLSLSFINDDNTDNDDTITTDIANNALSTAGNTDTAYDTATNTISGDYNLSDDAPADYQNKIDIFALFDDFIANNPISNIINNTGIVLSGATSKISFMYNNQEIFLDVSGFDNELELFGSILLSITMLTGMMMIFRG